MTLAGAQDTVTILRSHGPRLAKFIRADGRIDCYDRARVFDMAEVAVSSLDQLARLLRRLAVRRDLCVIRGRPACPSRTKGVRRLFHPDVETGDQPTIQDAAHRWIALDVEGVPRPEDVPVGNLLACARLAAGLLPDEFRSAQTLVQATSGHGLKPGVRMRLWFWADRFLSGAELARWCRAAPVDAALFRPAQITYTAGPLFARGRVDHLPARFAALPGEAMVVAPPAEALRPPPRQPAPPRPAPQTGTRGAERLLTMCLYRVETAAPGQRHDQLRAAARTVGGIIECLGIGAGAAEEYLLAAARRAGGPKFDEAQKRATIRWALERGQAVPLVFGGGHGRGI